MVATYYILKLNGCIQYNLGTYVVTTVTSYAYETRSSLVETVTLSLVILSSRIIAKWKRDTAMKPTGQSIQK